MVRRFLAAKIFYLRCSASPSSKFIRTIGPLSFATALRLTVFCFMFYSHIEKLN